MSERLNPVVLPDGESTPVPSMAVEAQPDTGPDTDDGVYITMALLNQLYAKASYNTRVCCPGCTCTPAT